MEQKANKNIEKGNKKIEKYLPIGSIVLLKTGKKKLMITGFCTVSEKEGKVVSYDYCGVTYPEGVISLNHIMLFNHNQIAKIYHIGYVNKEEKEFKEKLIESITRHAENNN